MPPESLYADRWATDLTLKVAALGVAISGVSNILIGISSVVFSLLSVYAYNVDCKQLRSIACMGTAAEAGFTQFFQRTRTFYNLNACHNDRNGRHRGYSACIRCQSHGHGHSAFWCRALYRLRRLRLCFCFFRGKLAAKIPPRPAAASFLHSV